ncbi:MAG: polysaccharide biosynthesis/export family protein [Candidatus Omnitrophica bacterium]|nr:polysaccharide biosynthesis/export family protein [Candidatus Omnitrophota bacterium]
MLNTLRLAISLLAFCLLPLAFPTPVLAEIEGYRLRPNDVIKLSIFAGGEMQIEVDLTITSKGFIACPFLGDIKAEYLTISELTEKIEEPLARDYFREPQVIISIKESKSPGWNVYVLGMVKKPGAYEFKEGLTALDACVLAQGFKDFAAPNRTTITRRENGENRVIKIDLNKVRKGKVKDIPLRPGDRIDIPESRL